MVGIVAGVVGADAVLGERVEFLVENVHLALRLAVLDVVVDGQRHALDGALQIRLAHRRLVHVDRRARVRLLQRAPLVKLQQPHRQQQTGLSSVGTSQLECSISLNHISTDTCSGIRAFIKIARPLTIISP